MKSALFVRPNLKLFLVFALIIVIANDLFVGLHMEASARALPAIGKNGTITDEELFRLRLFVAEYPTVEGCLRLCYGYQKRGEYRKAMHFLNRANRLAEVSGGEWEE